MADPSHVDATAGQLYLGIAQIARRVRQLQAPGELTVPQRIALSRLGDGPASAADLARTEQISPQAMGVTLKALEAVGLVARASDSADGRRVLMSLTEAGRQLLRHKQDNRARQFAKILTEGFTGPEQEALSRAAPLIVRLGDLL